MIVDRVTRDELVAEIERWERLARAAERKAEEIGRRLAHASLWDRYEIQPVYQAARERFDLLKEHWYYLHDDLEAFDREHQL